MYANAVRASGIGARPRNRQRAVLVLARIFPQPANECARDCLSCLSLWHWPGKAGFKVYDVTERSEEQAFESLAFVLRQLNRPPTSAHTKLVSHAARPFRFRNSGILKSSACSSSFRPRLCPAPNIGRSASTTPQPRLGGEDG